MAATPETPLTPSRKAAMLMVVLGQEVAGKLFRHLPPDEMAAIAREVATLGPIDPASAERVVEEYYLQAIRVPEPTGGREAARRFLAAVDLPAERVESILGPDADAAAELLGPLLAAEPEALARLLGAEHPQTAALVLLHLPAERAGRVLAALSETARAATVLRMANLRQVPGEVVAEIAASLSRQLDTIRAGRSASRGPSSLERTGAVLSSLPRSESRRLVDELAERDPAQAAQLRELIYSFESLAGADDRGIQELLRSVETKSLALALHGADEELQKKFMANLSERAAGMLRDEMEYLGNVRPDDRAAARKQIVDSALKLEQEGRLVFSEPAAAG